MCLDTYGKTGNCLLLTWSLSSPQSGVSLWTLSKLLGDHLCGEVGYQRNEFLCPLPVTCGASVPIATLMVGHAAVSLEKPVVTVKGKLLYILLWNFSILCGSIGFFFIWISTLCC